ncbi:MAG: Putative DNA-binding response regulator [Clostridiales bacterium 38_11]|nr:MAG: Putative DNA-binding response regulator [Clostridiales bacterium 38_11]
MDIRILACDNNRYQLDRLTNHIREFGIKYNNNLIIDKAVTGEETLVLHRQNRYHMVFLDIDLGDKVNGVEIAETIRKNDDNILIIFVTAYPDFTSKAYELFAFNYVVKPIEKQFFEKMLIRGINIVKSRYFIRDKLSITIDDGYENHKIPYDDIIYFEKIGKRVYFYLTDRSVLNPVMTLNHLDSLLEPGFFLRCHKSFMINHYKIQYIDTHQIKMKNLDTMIPIGRKYKESIDKAILKII